MRRFFIEVMRLGRSGLILALGLALGWTGRGLWETRPESPSVPAPTTEMETWQQHLAARDRAAVAKEEALRQREEADAAMRADLNRKRDLFEKRRRQMRWFLPARVPDVIDEDD